MDTSRPRIHYFDEGLEDSNEEANARSEDESTFHPSTLIDLQPPTLQPESLSITMTQVHAGELDVKVPSLTWRCSLDYMQIVIDILRDAEGKDYSLKVEGREGEVRVHRSILAKFIPRFDLSSSLDYMQESTAKVAFTFWKLNINHSI